MPTQSASVRAFAKVFIALAIVGAFVSQAATAGASSLPSRTKGFPVSANGASSMHLAWADDPAPTREISTVLEIVDAPSVQQLYFWAMQVEFIDARGKAVGEAHLGLQWHPQHPGGTAVNFGGYDGSSELTGDVSRLPSATGDANTRDYAWQTGHRYKLRVFGSGDGWWTGEVTDLDTRQVTVVRRLFGGGTSLSRPIVWSEVFAQCDDPSTAVRWSSFSPRPTALKAMYQTFTSGGCTNTTVQTSSRGVVQRTNAARTVRDFELVRSGF